MGRGTDPENKKRKSKIRSGRGDERCAIHLTSAVRKIPRLMGGGGAPAGTEYAGT